MTDRVAAFGAVLSSLWAAHVFADYWIQTHHQAVTKGLPGWIGRRACASHVASYTATAALVLWLVSLRTGLHLPLTQTSTALGFSGATHYWLDRRVTLERLARWTGKLGFYRLGSPRDGHNDNPTLGTGAHYLDQASHVLALLIAALILD